MRRSLFKQVLGLGLVMLGVTMLVLMLSSGSSAFAPLPPPPPLAPIAPLPPIPPLPPMPPVLPEPPGALDLRPDSGWGVWLNLGLLGAAVAVMLLWRRPPGRSPEIMD